MDNICTIPLYSRKDNSLDFLGKVIKESTLDNVVENVASFLNKEASFATTITVAEDQEKYEDNIINSLIPNLILEILTEFGRFSPDMLHKLQLLFKEKFIPKILENSDESVPKTETREETRNRKNSKVTLRQSRNTIFRGSNLLSDFHNKEFSKLIRNVIIYNSSNGQRTLVYDLKSLNENLKLYKQNLYEIIYDYCKSIGLPIPNKRSYYYSDNSVKGEEVLEAFYKYLMSLNPDERLAMLEKSWENKTLNIKENNNLLSAVNAYITLINFDELIKSTVGNYISINYKLNEPINNIEHNGKINVEYKYNFGRRQTNLQKDFRDVILNALDTMGNFSKFLIESIPRIDSTENITQILFVNALLHFKKAIRNLTPTEYNRKYQDALKNIHKEPKERWKEVLNDFANRSGYSDFLSSGLTLEDINIILSILRFIYGKSSEERKNSLYSLEEEVHNLLGYKEVYPLVDTILGTIDSISEINYQETDWDYVEDTPVTRIKRKYFNNKQKLDLISGINLEASKPLSESLKEKYLISYLGGPFTFKIGNNIFLVKPKKYSEFGIFDNDIEVTINGLEVSNYFKDVNLNGISNRNTVLNSESGLNKEFLDLLIFIDKVLTTGFSINNESLQKFYIYNTSSKTGLEDLIVAAARVYLVKDLERGFHNSIDKKEINPNTGNAYNKRELHDWMKNHKSIVPIPLFVKENNDLNKKFFASLVGIPYLKPVLYTDTWVDKLGDAQAILTGESLKAVTKNFERKNVPNYSPAFLGAEIDEINARNNENPVTSNLLFSSGLNSRAIREVIVDTDVKVSSGKTKLIKDMTEAELLYHFFVNKFLLPFKITDDKPYNAFIGLPTVYSDKSKFIGYEVSLTDLEITSLKDNENIINKIKETLGTYFSMVLKNILDSYARLFGVPSTVKDVLNELKKYTLKTLMDKVVEYNKTHDDKVELIQDLHYRVINGKLGLNEIIIYRNQYIMENLPKILKLESINYVNLLLNSGVIFDTTTGFRSALNEVASSAGVKIEEWIDSNGMLILAKQVTDNGEINIVAGEQISGDNIIVNPILEKYILLHNLINNNLKEGIVGIDAIHKVKVSEAKLSEEERKYLGFTESEQIDLVDALIKIKETENSLANTSLGISTEEEFIAFKKEVLELEKIEDNIYNQVRKIENLAGIALLKRTVTVPGTMRYYLQGTLTGILPVLKGAIVLDIPASVFNFEGDTKENLEAHDGEALLCPITAVFLNNSLQDSEVGDIIKPLWLVEIPTFGGKRLVKYAADTITNAMMKNSELSEISMYHMFKKMTHSSDPNSELRWGKLYQSEQKNLFNLFKHRRNNLNVSFSDITLNSGALYYSLGNRIYLIVGMGFDNGAYYTEELEVTILPNGSVKSLRDSDVTYFHYFDEEGNHYKVKEGDPISEGLHTIDSIYELHAVFGGIYSQSYNDGRFVTSDASIRATAALLNMVSEPTERCLKAMLEGSEILDTQSFYYLPLKYKMVDYLINLSAIKNGTGNINFNTTYLNPENELNDVTNDEPLRYIEMDTLRYGILLDSEHEADDEELTEMSLVISAIDAGGYYHQEVAELYKAIGYLALSASKVELSKISLFNERHSVLFTKEEKDWIKNVLSLSVDSEIGIKEAKEAISIADNFSIKRKVETYINSLGILYDLIGRVLIEHLSLNKGQNGIAESLVESLEKNFGSSTDHTLDDIKIAFSDLTIYSQIISTISSILNKKSVKRKFPGTGLVMAAGYNIVQLWNIDGNPARYEDLIKEALAAGFTSSSNVPEQYNKDIVRLYLADRQRKYAEKYTKVIPLKTDGTNYNEDFWESLLQYLNPIDIVQCTVDGITIRPIKLDKIKDYYLFKSNPIQYLLDKKLITSVPKELQIVKRIDIPSNLAPLQYKFVYEDENGIKHSKNVYDIWAVKDMYFVLEEFKKSLPVALTPEQKYKNDKAIELEKIRLRKIEQNVLSKLEENIYIDKNGKENKIIKSESSEALTLMSNIFRSKFGLKEGESLYDILKQGPEKFLKSPLKMLPNETIYDLAMLKSNGEGILISFNDDDIKSVEGFYKVKDKNFLNINEHEIEYSETDPTTHLKIYIDKYSKEKVVGETIDGSTIHSYIYSLDSNNVEIVPIAIKIDVSNLIEFDGENFIYKDSKARVDDNLELTVKEGKVLQTILFINQKIISPKHKNKYIVYNIKEKLLAETLGENFLQEIIKKLYQQDNYTYVMPAKYVNNNSLEAVKTSITTIRENVIDEDVRNYLKKFEGILNFATDSSNGLYQIKGYNNVLKDYNIKLAEKVFNSFKESLYFISSRIPAQSLQSFMKMKVVGFTNSGANMAYVTHWQAWLLGSDYDIDKSYMLGNEFDDNGLYQGWSPLFDYVHLTASKKLPFPTGIKAHMPKEEAKGISIENFVNEYISLDENDEEGKLNLYNRLIRFINELVPEYMNEFKEDAVAIAKFNDDKKNIRRKLVNIINAHNTYFKNVNNTEALLKNFISNKLLKIIQGTSNFIGSHAPISLDVMHEASDSSSHSSAIWTTLNPGYIPLMLTLAMVGKKGVGIAANGQKTSFIWKYWMTDSINNNNPYKEFVNFPLDFYIGRIEGRFGEQFGEAIETKYIKCLPDINMDNASEGDKLFYSFNENHYIPSDLMSSLMISAATDNAKELILDKINANTDLSKVYMYLITLGFDIKDIVSFMTSEAIDLIARNATLNIFIDTNFKPEDVAKYMLNSINSMLGLEETFETYSVDGRYSFVLDGKISALLEKYKDNSLKLQDLKADILEFLKIYELSEEFSYAGRLLGMNGGVPTTKEGLIKFKKFIKDMISSREVRTGLKTLKNGRFNKNEAIISSIIPEDLKDLVNNIDPDSYLADLDYRNRVIRYYEIIKGSLNIPAMIESTDLFRTILDIANVVNIIDNFGVAKSKAANIIYNKILERYPYTDSKYAMQILPILNQIFISQFLELNQLTIPILSGWKYISKKWEIKEFAENGLFTVGSTNYGLTPDISISSFHYLMDEHIIPALKNGELFDLKNNAFIQNLIPIVDGLEVRYKINIDMRAALTNPESKVILKDIIKGLLELLNYKFGNKNLLDIFMAYSLVVDQNKLGSDRLTDLFASFVGNTHSLENLLKDYYKFMGEIELNNDNFIDKINTLSTNGFLISLALQVVSDKGHNEPSIKVMNNDGRIDYKFNQGYGKYNSFGDFLPIVSPLEEDSDRLLRIATREQYKFGLIYDGYILDIIQNFEDLENSQTWIENFDDLMAGGYVNLDTICD